MWSVHPPSQACVLQDSEAMTGGVRRASSFPFFIQKLEEERRSNREMIANGKKNLVSVYIIL